MGRPAEDVQPVREDGCEEARVRLAQSAVQSAPVAHSTCDLQRRPLHRERRPGKRETRATVLCGALERSERRWLPRMSRSLS